MPQYEESYLNTLESVSFWMPLEPLSKSLKDGGPVVRMIQGVASTDDLDQQHEVVLQDGMDFEPLLTKGYINWNHFVGPENIIGQPIAARVVRLKTGATALHIKAALYENHPRAESAWNLINVLEKARKSGLQERRLGWSVEGGVLERRGGVIAKSVVRQLALTHEPVNASTFADLAKSLTKAASLGGAFDPVADAGSARSDYGPEKLQNLNGRGSARAIRIAMFGTEPDKCQTELGRFKKGGVGLFEHLAFCKGMDPKDAGSLVMSLHDSLTNNRDY